MLHGRPGEDGTIQGMLEIVGIPYTPFGRPLLGDRDAEGPRQGRSAAAGVPVPEGMVVSRLEAAKEHLLPPPYVIKPVAEGSSVGVFIVTEAHEHPPQELTREDWAFGDTVLWRRTSPARN